MRRAGRTLRAGSGVALVCAVVLGAPTTAFADTDDGLSETSRTRYEVDGSGPVRVTVTTTIRNEQPASAQYVYYWDAYGIPVPAGATDVTATSGGATLPVTLEPTEDPSTRIAGVSFSPLNYGRERTVEWSYTIPGEPIRSEGYTRVGPGYATFAVNAAGDPGQVTVEIATPTSMDFDSTWDGFEPILEGETRTHRATESTDDYGTWAFVSLRDPAQADETSVDVGGNELVLESFPGDTEWSGFVEEQVVAGMPALERAVGMPWPGSLERIREDVSPGVLGYAWFDSASWEVVIPEDLDAGLLFHELSHAWLAGDRFADRWVYEGLAEVVGQRVAAETGGPAEQRPAPARDAADAVPLVAWDEVDLDDGAGAAEEYAYAASWTAMTELVGGLDDDVLGPLVAAAYAGESAYDAPGTLDHPGLTDGRRLLDLVEVRGGVAGAEATYRTWVADADETALLDARAPAREAYAALDAADGAWSPPAGLRAAMTDWAFGDAEAARTAIGPDAAADAGQVQEAARAAGLPDPAAVREQYEGARSAEEYAALATTLPRAVEVVGSVGDAVAAAAAGGPLADLGQLLLDVDGSAADARAALDDGRLDDAAAAAGDASSRAAAAPWLGTGSVLLVVVALAGVVVLLVRRRARRRARPEGEPAVDGDRPDGSTSTDDATPAEGVAPAEDGAPADDERAPGAEPSAEDGSNPGEEPSVDEEPEPVKA
ncbi:hypothetical protein FB00_19135 [Cellulosimicrobium funkei]|uniref:Peptidase M1 membrane alanine aminopeptidase domain-containing protein n=1 Tax=Cellulosimicrobium funkei TaxID=264251 RepID=A0A0H2KI33_9MICO|nr:hypothetical protein [Cellulosimicrobium funkei]KLN33156.1 hypothetical protein FB00_19135 [Cellulosimicrobium funkei]